MTSKKPRATIQWGMDMTTIKFIAEIGQNHIGNLNIGLYLIRACIEAGADYIKFQLYDTDAIFDGTEKFYKDTLQAELTKNQAKFLARATLQLGGQVMFSVFDERRLSWALEIHGNYYGDKKRWPEIPIKIASRTAMDEEILHNLEVIKKGKVSRPIHGFVSLGMKHHGLKEYDKLLSSVDFLFCKSEYPCTYTDEDWVKFAQGWNEGTVKGFSDHSIGTQAIEKAISLGATIIEKHITFDKKAPGPDHHLSITPEELRVLIDRYKEKDGNGSEKGIGQDIDRGPEKAV